MAESSARLFVATPPPPELVSTLRDLPRPRLPGVRWTTPDQWHLTLRFVGRVPFSSIPALTASLQAAAGDPVGTGVGPCWAEAGPTVERLGKQVLCVPVKGLDALAAGVRHATEAFGEPPEPRPFRGHLTVARARGKRRFRGADAGAVAAARWEVTVVDVVQSHLEPEGARYETLARVALSEG